MNVNPTPEHQPNFDNVKLPSPDAKELLRILLLDFRFDSVDLWPLFGREPVPSFTEIADSIRRLLLADGIARTRPLQRVSINFINYSAEECALNAERWGAAWGQWMNQHGDGALAEWRGHVSQMAPYLTDDTIKSHPEIVFINPMWLGDFKSELIEVQELFTNRSRSLFLKMREHSISPESPHFRYVIDTWGSAAYGLIENSGSSILDGFTPEEIKNIHRIVDLLAEHDQLRLLPELFLTISPRHFREHAEIFYQAITIDPSKVISILELFPTTPRKQVREVALNAIRYGGPTAKETLSRLGDPREEFVDEIDHLIFHSGVFGYQALRYRLPKVLANTREEWLPELYRYGHGFWALMAKFKTDLLEGISQNREFIDEVFPLCTSGTGRFLHTLPLSLWNNDGVMLADMFRESAGEVWSELQDDALKWATEQKYCDLRGTLLHKGRIRGIHRYIPFGKSGDERFDTLRRIAHRLEDRTKNSSGKKTALFLLAGTDPLNSFGGSSPKRILKQLLEGFDVTVQEVRSKYEIDQSLQQISFREEGAPLPLFAVAAHGDSYGMQFGGLRHMLPCPADKTLVSFQNYLSIRDRELVRSWRGSFSTETDIVTLSCSNFLQGPSSGGFGRMLQEELLPATIHGMRWSMVPLKIDFDTSNRATGIIAR